MFAQGELEHRHVKRLYSRTNKIRYEIQIAGKNRKILVLRRIAARDTHFKPRREGMQYKRNLKVVRELARDRARTSASCEAEELDLNADPRELFSMGKSRNKMIRIHNWLAAHADDPATEVLTFPPACGRIF